MAITMDTPERIAKLEAQVESIKDDVGELKSDVKEIHSRITTGNREIMEKIESMDAAMEARMAKNAETSAQQHSEIKKSLQADINKVTDRVDTLEKWRWMIVGGAIVLGYVVGHMGLFSKIFG
jgi:predicted RNase H-like nuclease (RuvC/YqgF family)